MQSVKRCHRKNSVWYIIFSIRNLLESTVPILGCDIRHDVLIEELQNEGDAVCKHQVLGHVLKL